ncbi:sensor histidine kinase [Mycetocola tolaasinivorans]|nr:HAMP domain-containing sensor histidine kinase [Mycetocola tolaasinivorans]
MRLPSRPVSGRRFRLTIRTRLALTYSAVLTVSGVLMLGVMYVVLGLLPSYAFAVVPGVPANTSLAPVTPTQPLVSETQSPTVGTVDNGVVANNLGTPSLLVSSREDLQRLFVIAAIGILLALVVGGAWLGWYLAGRMLRPLRDIGRATTLAARGNLDHRLAFTGPEDEITDLADSFDRMMGELETSFGAQRRFAANASHELRTPLATTRAMLDVALGAAGTGTGGTAGASVPAASQTVLLDRLRTMNERSIATVDALMDLAEIETGTDEPALLRLDQTIAQVVEECTDEARAHDITVAQDLIPTHIREDPRFVQLLAVNLVHNAIRHNHDAGRVWVSVQSAEPGTATLCVENTGTVIDEAQITLLREPFSRAAGRARGGDTPGRGLGLSIVSAIAERCGSHLELTARPGGGLIASVTFRTVGGNHSGG